MITEMIIHALGGITADEARRSEEHIFVQGKEHGMAVGRSEMAHGMKRYAEYLHGREANDWCRLMYQHLCEVCEQME